MTEINGALVDRISMILLREGAIVAGMVVDEQNSTHAKTQNQRAMLAQLRTWYCPIILVEFNPPLRTQKNPGAALQTRPTNQTLSREATGMTERVAKGYFNAMVQTDLKVKLRAYNITYVVLMGQETNCCVRCTAIGGDDVDKKPYDGLVQNGFTVLTAPDLLHSTAPSDPFKTHDMVEMYARSA